MTDSEYVIIFVPGIRPKPKPEEHAAQLSRCIHAGVLTAGGSDSEAAAIAARFELVGWSHEFYGEHADIARDMPGIERLLVGTDTVAAARVAATSFNRRYLAFMYALVERWPSLARRFSTERMKSRVAEIDRYFADEDGEARAAWLKVGAHIRAAWLGNKKVLVVGHSFGAAIAYDVLWRLSREPGAGVVDTFLTMGNPMSMSYIRSHLQGADQKGADRYPLCIRRWHNLNAIGEPTSLGNKMSDLFAPMRELNLLESLSDDLSMVNRFNGADGFNPHKCFGYFANEKTGSLLLNWVRNNPA